MFSLRSSKSSLLSSTRIRFSVFRCVVILSLVVLMGMWVVGCGSTSSPTSASGNLSPTPTATPESVSPTPTPTPTLENATPTTRTPIIQNMHDISPTPTLDNPTPTPTSTEECSAQPGFICGKVVDSQGNPLSNVTIDVTGNETVTGQEVSRSLSVRPDGTYGPASLPDGSYGVKATLSITYRGNQFGLELYPDDGENHDLRSADGIVKNFTWKLTGLKPGLDAYKNEPTSYYGAYIGLEILPLDSGNRPEGTRYHFTLAPQGPLVDGSTGQTLTFDKTTNTFADFADGNNLRDIPLGVYTVDVTATAPDGTPLSLHLSTQTIMFSNEPNAQGIASLTITND